MRLFRRFGITWLNGGLFLYKLLHMVFQLLLLLLVIIHHSMLSIKKKYRRLTVVV